jgi:hypothetical protein
LVGLFVALSLFWAAGLDAESIGRSEARDLAAHLDRLPGVVLNSHDGLSISSTNAGGIETTVLSSGYYPYEYRGLRLFANKNGVLFLIPREWRHDNDVPLLNLALSDKLRFAVTPGVETAQGSALGLAAKAGGPIAVGAGAPVYRTDPRRFTIVEVPRSQSVKIGGRARFTITVRNRSGSRLTHVSVSDARSSRCNRSLGTLAAGKSHSYTCSRAGVRRGFVNVVAAFGDAHEPLIYRAFDRAAVAVHP